jgi:phosphopantothenoylcysteine synthetase/decarboxylase
MRQLTVTIPDSFYETFISFFKHIPDVSIAENATNEVPLWQQEMVLERIKNAKPEDYRSWEDVKKELDKKWNFNG